MKDILVLSLSLMSSRGRVLF
jgi:hypothetical protein